MAFDFPTEPVSVSSLEPGFRHILTRMGYYEVNGTLVPPPAVLSAADAQAQAYASENNAGGQPPVAPGTSAIQGVLDNIGQVAQNGMASLAGYIATAGSAGATASPSGQSAGEAYGEEQANELEFDRKNPSPPGASPYGPSAGEAYGEEMDAAREFDARAREAEEAAKRGGRPAGTGAGPHPSSTDPAERAAAAASSPGFNAENPGRINVNGVMMTPEEYSAYMGGAGSSPDRATEAERAAANGGTPTAVVAPGSAADQAGAGAPDVPNGGPGSPGYDSSTRPEDGLNGFVDYDKNGIDDRTQSFVGSGVFNNPGAIMPGAAGTSPVGGWGNAINTGVGGPVDFGGGGGGGLSLGGYGDLGGYPGGGGAAGPASGGNFSVPGADGGGFTAPPAPSFQFPDVSTIGGGATGATGGTGSGGFTMPEFQNPLTGGTAGGGSSATGGGSTGGTGVATTTGGGAGGSTPLVGQLAGSYQSAIDSANAANENRFGTGLELLLKRAEQAGAATQGLTYEGMNDIGRMFGQNRARSDQDLINRGLANTTVREGVMRGYATDEQAARNRYADDQTRKNIDENFRQQQGLVDWLGARNDVGPDVGQLANLASGVGAAGPSAGTTTPTTGATTPTTTTPTAGTQPATQPAAPRVTTPANPNGAFTKSSAPNPTINQPAASPQAATSLAGYGQSSASPAAATMFTAQQISNVQNMFSGAADAFRVSADRYATSRKNTAKNKAELAASAGPIQIGNPNVGKPPAAIGSDWVNPMADQVMSQEAAKAQQMQSYQATAAQQANDPVMQEWYKTQNEARANRGLPQLGNGVMLPGSAGFMPLPQDGGSSATIGGGGQNTLSNTTGSNGTPTPPPPGMPPVQNLVGANPLTMPTSPTGIDMAQFGGGGAQHINNRNPSQTGMPNPPPPSISGTINGQTFMSGGMAPSTPSTRPLVGSPPLTMPGMGPQPAPAGPSLMGYPEPKSNPMPIDAPRPSSSPMGMQMPTARLAGTNFEFGGANTPQFSNPSPAAQPAPAMATQSPAPSRAMASGSLGLPASPQSYSPQPMPQGMGQVPTNQVYMGANGIPVYTDPNGQRKPANYYPSLNQYGVMA